MKHLGAFLQSQSPVISVEVAVAKGSTPREQSAFMLVSTNETYGTIGGGRLELDAIAKARTMLIAGEIKSEMNVALGPDINQCCGGRVVLQLHKLNETEQMAMSETATLKINQMPEVLIFGAGHVGRALALALAPLPFRISLIDPRPHALLPVIHGITSLALPVPEQAVRDAKPGSSFVVMTHEHSLDFLIINEALKRNDAAYVGLIGSKTKKVLFRSQYLADGGSLADFAKLTSPIGANPTGDKRPEVIAAFVAAELCMRLLAPKSEGGYA
jgi:xanthine dehydrogenase accessory factor